MEMIIMGRSMKKEFIELMSLLSLKTGSAEAVSSEVKVEKINGLKIGLNLGIRC
jgi:hypothetical protein